MEHKLKKIEMNGLVGGCIKCPAKQSKAYATGQTDPHASHCACEGCGGAVYQQLADRNIRIRPQRTN